MKILINALSVTTGGGFTSLLNLLPALQKTDARNEYFVLLSEHQRTVRKGIPDTVRTYVVHFNPKVIVVRLLYEQFVLPFVLWRLNVDWLYSVGNITTLLAPCKVLLVIENANPYSRYRFAWTLHERLRNGLLNILGRLSAWRATKIRFLSMNSKQLISSMLGIPERKSVVIPQGVALNGNPGEHAQAKPNIPKRYILTVTNIGPHKNLHTLLEAFEAISKTYSGFLLIVGEATYHSYFQRLLEQKRQSSSGDRVVFAGWVEPKNLPPLYAKADLFVFPSVEETFGLPVLEAMASGIPVLVPDAGEKFPTLFLPYKELCGNAAMYFDPFDSKHLGEQMQKILGDQALRERLSHEGMSVAARYRWEDVASKLVEVFREA